MKSSIEFIRFVFICIIAIWHDNTLNVFSHSVVVEFFFILSGFLLYNSYRKDSSLTPFDFAKKRISRLYCEYVVALLITLIINVVKEPTNKEFLYSQIGSIIPELLMVQSVGIFQGGINPINWYIQVMFIGSVFLYALLYCSPKYSKYIIIPGIVLSGFTYLFSRGDSVVQWETIGCIHLPMLRGMCSLSLGVLSAYVYFENNNINRFSSFITNVGSILALGLILISTRLQIVLDKYIIFLSPIIIIACFEEKSWLNRIFHSKWQIWLGRISYAMLLVHCAYIPVFHKLLSVMSLKLPLVLMIGMYLLTLVLLSAGFQWVCDMIRHHLKVLVK